MKTVCGLEVAAALLSVALGPALVGHSQTPVFVEQQDLGRQGIPAGQVAALLQPDNEALEGQEAQQKVVLELVAADAHLVKGKPYSADTSTETVQTLADGNRIVRRTVGKFYRDSDGRTRREQTFGNVNTENPTPHEVKAFIDDPVNGAAFVLDPELKSADRVKRTRKFIDERSAEEEGTPGTLKTLSDSEAGELPPPGHRMIKLREDHPGNSNALFTVMPDENRDVVKEDLGTRNLQGLDCTGTRQTITIQSGAVGNEKPITIVTETWFAPSIAAVVQSTTDDPRYGKTTYQLTNVQLNEPARSLFEPPANFNLNVRK